MRSLASLLAFAAVLAILLLSAIPCLAIGHKYTEDFATSEYKDALNTTAWWDTVTGELKLHPFVPTLVGSYNTPGTAYGVAVSGDHAFVADRASGLQVIDISDPTSPTLVGSYNTPGNAYGVAVSGDRAFVADGDYGLQVIDISDPAGPTLVGAYDTPGNAFGVAVSGDHAFVADYLYGLQVIDISDPASPTLVGTYNTPGIANSVVVSGDHAFIADITSSLQVIDISDPTNPTRVGVCGTPGDSYGIAVSGDRAFVADETSGLQVIDISDPTNPTLLGACDTPGYAYGIAVSGDHAFVADYASGLQVIDISDPANPTLAGTCDTPGNAWGVTVSGNKAFVADQSSGLQVISIGDPTIPTLAGSWDTPGNARGAAIAGDHIFVADEAYGLQAIDIGDPTSPVLVGTLDTPSYAMGVTVAGDYAFVADGESGLQVIDISDPASPTIAGTCDTPDYAYGVAISGDHAFVADWSSGLHVIDISDPGIPALVGTCDTPGDVRRVTVAGDYAFVADGLAGLQVIDISAPTSPTIAGSYSPPDPVLDVAVSGDNAFAANYSSGLLVLDISDPTSPALVGTIDTPSYANSVTVSGDYAFVTDGAAGLHVIDISDPTSPTIAGTYNTPGSAMQSGVSGDLAFVADYAAGLQVIQVFQSEVDHSRNVGWSLAVDASNDTIFSVRLTTTQTNTVTWELSADGGASWQGIAPDGNWNQSIVPGIDLIWRSTHAWAAPGVNPGVSEIEIDWLLAAASIESIVDIPDDQGGWVRVHFTRSARDFSGEVSLSIENYGIWQRVDDPALIAALGLVSPSLSARCAAGEIPREGGMPVLTYQARTYIRSQQDFGVSSLPPGTWEWVATIPATQEDIYIARVPTTADSSGAGTNHSVFIVTAHTTTPSIWYVSAPDSGYSVDNIAPGVPEGFAVAYNTGSGNELVWDECPDEDFQYFRVYRSSDPDFVPSPAELVHSLAGTSWNDPEYDGWGVYYKITALDHAGNESGPASPGTVTAAEQPAMPQTYGLYPNVPNPFNPSTTIRYDVPAGGGAVTLRIYDVSGRLVRTLADGPQAAGQKTVVWNGRDDRGRRVVSGVYFYRLDAPGYKKTLKMILIQ